ncbi:TetR/AcrR family transcriptional regulator [Mycobacterium simiae]|uniref:TetR/AcrR family transcriptional regulator n=1 Tax=Mycobacterium simiae TaxID=1784 RepID=UPI002601D15E|nr:TetR/AcrR family transcriptional regulator [Mycobacterium simiae]
MTRAARRLPAPKQSRSELSTAKLLDAAAELIAHGGYERMTLAGIGERAGYSHGLVTARFGSKEGLLWALMERMVVDWQDNVLNPALGRETGITAVKTIYKQLAAAWRHHPARMRAFYTLMFEALLPVKVLNDRVIDLHREFRAGVAELVQRGIAGGQIDDRVDVERVTRLLVGALRGAVYQSMLDPDEVAVSDAIADLELLVEALLPPPRARRKDHDDHIDRSVG